MTVHTMLACDLVRAGDELTDEGVFDADCPRCGRLRNATSPLPAWAPHGYSLETCGECSEGRHCWAYDEDGVRWPPGRGGHGVHANDYGGTHCHCGVHHLTREEPERRDRPDDNTW